MRDRKKQRGRGDESRSSPLKYERSGGDGTIRNSARNLTYGRREMSLRLQVMKFGGTSVGNSECIARTAQIIARGAKEGRCVAVVSAMSGVTNKLIEAAKTAQAGNVAGATTIIDALRAQHEKTLQELVKNESERERVRQRLEAVLLEGRRFCEGTALLRELSPRTLDTISSLGERLSAPLVSATVKELGLLSEPVEAIYAQSSIPLFHDTAACFDSLQCYWTSLQGRSEQY